LNGSNLINIIDDPESQVNHSSAYGYDVLLTQSYSQRVVIPKVQNIVQENVETENDVLGYDVNFVQIPYEDIKLLAGNVCRPDRSIIEEAHEKFNRDLTINIHEPFESHTFTVQNLDLSSDKEVSVRNGLTSLSITVGNSGAQAVYTFSNKVAQPIKPDLTRRLIQLNRKRKTKS